MSDHKAHQRSLISLHSLPKDALNHWIPTAHCEDFDHTTMRKRILVSVGASAYLYYCRKWLDLVYLSSAFEMLFAIIVAFYGNLFNCYSRTTMLRTSLGLVKLVLDMC